MSIRKLGGVGLVALTFVGLIAFSQNGQTALKEGHEASHEAMQSCAKVCSDCQRACDSCSTHCVHMVHAGKSEHMTTLMSCRDCATVCAAAAQIVSRSGPYSTLICDCCAKACDQCGTACEKFPDDKHMKACAEECRKCEKACKTMLMHTTNNS